MEDKGIKRKNTQTLARHRKKGNQFHPIDSHLMKEGFGNTYFKIAVTENLV